jgi:nucleoside diphosphate kinase
MIQRDLTKEEALNLFYKHQNKDYTEKLMNYILSGECIILMLTHERLDPITTWKKMIGNMDPVEAKVDDDDLCNL